jgi:hypothetical protein
MPFSLEERRPVWQALSCLFLDTDTALFTEGMVRTLAASPYSPAELNDILIDEVYPACRWNLLSIAGEWAGFDEAWLEGRILARRKSRFPRWLNPGRIAVPRSPQWRHVLREVRLQRQEVGRAAARPGS